MSNDRSIDSADNEQLLTALFRTDIVNSTGQLTVPAPTPGAIS